MDGFAYQQNAPNLLGILYAEDFDELPPAPTPLVEVATFDQADVDRACIAAVASARRDWEASLAQHQADALAGLREALAATRASAERLAEATAEAAVQTMLAVLLGALPDFSRRHAPAEVASLVAQVLPTLRAEPQVTIRVHAELVDGLRNAVSTLDLETSCAVAVLPADLRLGDVKVSWTNGNLGRDTAQIQQAMQDALGMLGLQPPAETLTKRSMAHAE